MQAVLVYVIFLILVLWLLAVWPGRGRAERMEAFSKQLIAHRGLHDNSGPAPENSLAAFRLAAEQQYGIELDVRETADGMLVVAHDDSLKRLAGMDKKISEMNWSELRKVTLFRSEEHIPKFEDVLREVAGRVPLIVEIKSETKDVAGICENTVFYLDSYEGTTCIESFNPLVVRWFRKNRPETLRGQLSERFSGHRNVNAVCTFFLSLCFFNFLTKPDFIAYNWKHAHLFRFQVLRTLLRATTAAWTVKDEQTLRIQAQNFDVFICEGFLDGRMPAVPDGKNVPEKLTAGRQKMKNIVRKHMLVSGTVTAVGFRYRATYIAQNLGITGWVRNTWDDRVEMEVQGTPQMLAEMLARLNAQPYIEICNVEEELIPVEEKEYEFKVRY